MFQAPSRWQASGASAKKLLSSASARGEVGFRSIPMLKIRSSLRASCLGHKDLASILPMSNCYGALFKAVLK